MVGVAERTTEQRKLQTVAGRERDGNDFILQQDNCSIHVSKLMKEWMAKGNMTTLEWPARSPEI